MDWQNMLICLAAGYLIGNFQTSVLLSRLFFHDDIRKHGSKNAGTTNMLRVYGMTSGAITFVGDFIKAIVAVLVGRWIFGEVGGYLAGAGTVLGHNFPILFGFHGGKGVASTLGIAWMIAPLFAAITTVVTFAVIFITKTVSLGSLLGSTLFVGMVLLFEWGNWVKIGFCCFLLLMVIIRHIENIKRIIRGEEAKLFQPKKKREADKQNNQ